MGKLSSHADYRAFINQVIDQIEINAAELTAAGFDPTELITQLKADMAAADEAEAAQVDAHKIAKDKTQEALNKLDVAYKATSQAIKLVSGFLGDENSFVKELKGLRK